MNKYNDRISYLLENYTFQQLGTNDEKLVLENISESEYEVYSKIISESRLNASESLPKLPVGIKRQLTKDFNNKFRTQKIPYLKRGIASVTILILGGLIGYSISQYNIPKESTIQIPQTPITLTDTIYINRVDTVIREIIPDPQIIIKEVFTTDNKTTAINQSKSSRNESENISNLDERNPFTNIELDDLKSQNIGIPVREETDLMDLLQTMPSDRLD